MQLRQATHVTSISSMLCCIISMITNKALEYKVGPYGIWIAI